MAKIKVKEMQTQGQYNYVLSKRKPKLSTQDLFAAFQAINNPLKNVVGIYEQQKTLQA